ncbi:TPA: sulfur carrier protein ThiS [Providencia alcalifaciens]|nr:sulfur carrier protein ThiS [Providencia alcalifaciens]
MHIIINDQLMEVESPITVHQLLTQLGQGTSGSALAINQVIIPKSQWESHFLNEQDNILLFQAIAGG